MSDIIIIGSGLAGNILAEELADKGNNICLLDDYNETASVPENDYRIKHMKAIEFDNDILMEAGIKDADAFFAVTSNDSVNITLSLIAKRIYHVPKIIVKQNDPCHSKLFRKLNVQVIDAVTMQLKLLQSVIEL